MLMLRILSAGICLLLFSFVGCGKPAAENDWLETHPAIGTVMINGVPASGAIVRLYPTSPQPHVTSPVIPTGTVQKDGTFELTSYRTGDGAPEGDYRVTLEWPDSKLNASKGGMPEDPPDRLKNRFANPERSTIQVHVAPGENQLDPITLEKVEILSGSSLQ